MASLHKPERGCGTPLLRAGRSRSRGSPSRSRGWHSLPAPRDRALCPCTGTASCRQESEEGMQKQEPWKQQVGTLLVLFIYFPNPQAKQPQIMAGKEHMAESSAPEWLWVPPSWSSQCWLACSPGRCWLQPRASSTACFTPQPCQAQCQSIYNFHSNEVNAC